ncbi:hypothetical protein G6F68_013192 [Rhizopus microsporus]|nr:hypothetical protein G6F68_013192 [Rhizopus microsporus]
MFAVALVEGDVQTLSDAAKHAISVSNVKVVSVDNLNELATSGLSAVLAKSKEVTAPQAWSQLPPAPAPVSEVSAPSLETPYLKMLDQVFQNRLDIANAVHSASIWSVDQHQPESAAPEFGYGKVLSKIQQRARFIDAVEEIVKEGKLQAESSKVLSQWLLAVKSSTYDVKAIQKAAEAVLATVTDEYVLQNEEYLLPKSNWLIGSDSWAYDLGQSGVHHVIAQATQEGYWSLCHELW